MIGITGGIGSGKSRCSRFLAASFQLRTIDADSVCRNLLAPGEEGYRRLADFLPGYFFAVDGQLDRPMLRKVLFDDEQLRWKINQIIHPLVRGRIRDLMEGDRRTLVEVPLLFEAGWQGDFKAIIVVYANYLVRRLRIMKRDSVDQVQAEAALNAQGDLFEKTMAANHVIDNSGPWSDTCLQLLHLGRKILLINGINS